MPPKKATKPIEEEKTEENIQTISQEQMREPENPQQPQIDMNQLLEILERRRQQDKQESKQDKQDLLDKLEQNERRREQDERKREQDKQNLLEKLEQDKRERELQREQDKRERELQREQDERRREQDKLELLQRFEYDKQEVKDMIRQNMESVREECKREVLEVLVEHRAEIKEGIKEVIDEQDRIKTQMGRTSQRVTEFQENICVELEEQQRKIKEIEKEVREKTREENVRSIPIIPEEMWIGGAEPAFKFEGRKYESPMMFLTNVENYTNNIKDERKKIRIVQRMLKGNAELWYSLVQDQIQTFNDFKEKFKQQYWGEAQQNMLREEFARNKYNPNYNMSREIYIMQKYQIAKYFTPTIPEASMVVYLARQLEDHIFDNVILQNIETMSNLFTYLRRHDQYKKRTTVSREGDQQNNRQNYRDNNNVGNGNRNNYNYNNRYNNNNSNNRNVNNTYRNTSYNQQQRGRGWNTNARVFTPRNVQTNNVRTKEREEREEQREESESEEEKPKEDQGRRADTERCEEHRKEPTEKPLYGAFL